MWKTTDRYVQQKRLKAVDAESKLKQVYIPNYTKPNSAMINNLTTATPTTITATAKGGSILNGSANGNLNSEVTYSCGKPCESCSSAQSTQVRTTFKQTRPPNKQSFFSYYNFFNINYYYNSGMLGDQRI